eukprot:Clim_evm54s151 gene=Clim_evmTU54s151
MRLFSRIMQWQRTAATASTQSVDRSKARLVSRHKQRRLDQEAQAKAAAESRIERTEQYWTSNRKERLRKAHNVLLIMVFCGVIAFYHESMRSQSTYSQRPAMSRRMGGSDDDEAPSEGNGISETSK